MESSQVQPAPCPKCGGVRFLADGRDFGLNDTLACSALYCTNCGYVEFYANRSKLANLAQERADALAKAEIQSEKDTERGRS